MIMKKLLSLFLLIALSLTTWAQAPQELPKDPNVRYGVLDNGLTYYIRHNAYPEKRAEFYIAQKVGSMQEEDSQMGLAHFLEHMAFNGTKHFPGRKTLINYLETKGAKFGANLNAYTSFDETVYNLSQIPVADPTVVDSCLLILHDWSGFITLEDSEIDKERAIIKEEWRTRGDANWRYWEKAVPVLLAGTKYENRMPIGTMEVVENFEYQVLKDYYHKWYRPDLQAIVVVGDIDAEAVEAKVKQMFSDIPKPVNPAERVYYPVPDNEEPIVSIVSDPEAAYTAVSLYVKHDVFPFEMRATQQGYVFELVKRMASSMMSARMAELAQKGDSPFGAAYAYDGDYIVAKTKGAWTTVGVAKEGKVKETLEVLARETERVKQFGFTETELERAKANMLKSFENSFNNRNKQKSDSYVQEYVSVFLNGDAFPGIEFEYNFVKQMFPMINAQMVNAMLKQILGENNIAVSVFGPEAEGIVYPTVDELKTVLANAATEKLEAYAEEVITEPLVSNLPTAGKVVKVSEDKKNAATVWELSNGMKVVLKKTDFKDDEIRMSSLGHGGTSQIDDKDILNAELVSMVPQLGGIGNFSSTDLRKVLAGKTASVKAAVGKITQGISGNSSVADFETLLQLTYLYFTAPRKDVEAYTSMMSMVKDQLKNSESDPSSKFQEAVTLTQYGNNPRYKQMKAADVDNLDYDRIIEIYKQLFANPGSFTFTFVGNIDEATMKPLIEKYLGALPAGNPKIKMVQRDDSYVKGNKVNRFEQEMKTPKTSALNLFSGTMDYNLKNDVIISAIKQILDIVYTKTVREDEGGTYGVGVGARLNRYPYGQTALMAVFDTDPEKIDKLNPIIEREMKKIAEQGPSELDLQKVKEYMIKKYHEDVKTNAYWTNALVADYFYNDDMHTDYLKTVTALTVNDVKEFMSKLLSQGNKIEVIMNPKQ